jgi:hypothetical protein
MTRMAVEIYPYTKTLENLWDRFVWKSNNGTLFHTRRFLKYHPKGRFDDFSLLFKEGNRIVAVIPAAVRVIDEQKILFSHCGASYGGFVYNEDLSILLAFDLVSKLLDYAKIHGISRVELTFPPIIYQKQPNNYLDFALYKNGFQYRKREISSIIPLDFSSDDILSHFKPESRTAYRKSDKWNVRVMESTNFKAFYPILQKNLKMRHNVTPTHTLKELEYLKALFPQRIRHFEATYDNRIIAGVTNFLCNDRVVLAFYISHDESYQKYRPVNHLFYEIIQWSIKKEYKYLDFGIFTVNEDPNWGLGKFKESFGARGIFRDTLYKNL